MVQNYTQLCSQRGPKRSQTVENGQNSIKNLPKEKKVSATHGKRALNPKNPILARFLGSNGHYLTYNIHFFSPEDVKNQVRKLIGGRKVGVTQEKMGI